MKLLVVLLACLAGIHGYNYADLALKLCPDANHKQWTIHGFWPEYSEHKWPSWCNKTRYREFNETTIEPIRVMLVDLWGICPSWTKTSDVDLWKHEWEKHGTCTDETVFEYFQHAVDAYFYAEANDWFKCCPLNTTTLNVPTSGYLQCLIPFSKNDTTVKWLGYCHRSGRTW